MAVIIGGKWNHTLYFGDFSTGNIHSIKNNELIQKSEDIVGSKEEILSVFAYKTPLLSAQLTMFFSYHLYIVFETKKWFWSIEKDGEGITIQRSKNYSFVRYIYLNKYRQLLSKFVKADVGKNSVGDLIRWLYNEDELNKPYNVVSSNCKAFAKRVFDYIARTTKS